MLTFAGFHADRDSHSLIATGTSAALEARRRLVCQIFTMDKLLATFVGRPPLLIRRYCAINLPLDLTDATLLCDKDTFQDRLLQLDVNGWNTDHQFRSSTILRARAMIALIRDEILEIGLSYTGEYDTRDITYGDTLSFLDARSLSN